MSTTLELIRDAVIYKRVRYPLDPDEVLAYLQVRNFVKPSGQPFTIGDIRARLQDAVNDGNVVNTHGFYWFPDIPVSDRDYLRAFLTQLLKKRPSVEEGLMPQN